MVLINSLILIIIGFLWGFFVGKDYQYFKEPMPSLKRFLNRKIKIAKGRMKKKNLKLEEFNDWHKKIVAVFDIAIKNNNDRVLRARFAFTKSGEDMSIYNFYVLSEHEIDMNKLYNDCIGNLEAIIENLKQIDLEPNINTKFFTDYE